MKLSPQDLYPTETILESRAANAIITVAEHGLSRFAFDDLMWTVGLQGKESIGGKLHLTNYRLIFKSHRINRVKGTCSIFLPTIQELKNASRFLVRKLRVITLTQTSDFIVFGIPGLIKSIEAVRSKITQEDTERLRESISEDMTKWGTGLEVQKKWESLNQKLLHVRRVSDLAKSTLSPLEFSSLLTLGELLLGLGENPESPDENPESEVQD